MAWETPLRLPLATGDSGYGAAAATGLSGAIAFGPLFILRYLPDWAFWLSAGLVLLWLLLMIGLAIQMWSHRASDVRLDASGATVRSGPLRGRRLTWAELGARSIATTRDGAYWELRLGKEVLLRTNEPEEGASLEALAATLRAGASDRIPDAPLRPEVSKCQQCGAPLEPRGGATTACRFCQADNVLPERVRHVASAAGASEDIERAVASLLRWPPARRVNVWLAASFGAAVLGWPFFAAAALVHQSRPGGGLIELAVLFGCGISAAVTFPSLLSLGVADRRSFELLSARFAASAPTAPDAPYGCRYCGGPLPEPFGRATTPAVARCAYCESHNVVGLGLSREALAASEDAQSLPELAKARFALRRRRRLRAIVPALLVALSPLHFANVMFELPCFGPVASCTDANSARWCVGGERVHVRCDGPRGCAREGLHIFCDQSVAAEGDRCLGPPAALACTDDAQLMLQCQGEHNALIAACRGPRGCYLEEERLHCDTSVSVEGEACRGDVYSCPESGDALLACRDARWLALHPADSCSIEDGRLVWTGAYAVVGERCAGTSIACTDDDRLLRCRDAQLEPFVRCTGPAGCTSEGASHRCDQSRAEVGDACAVEAACSLDGRSLLRCEEGVFALGHACPGGCTAEAGRLSCRSR